MPSQRRASRYRCKATSVERFIQQLAVSYITNGYWFYVTRTIPEHKDPRAMVTNSSPVKGSTSRNGRDAAEGRPAAALNISGMVASCGPWPTNCTGTGTAEARPWVKPLLKQVRNDKVANVITHLQDLKPRMQAAAAQATEDAIEHYQNNQ